jgi:outer membrane biosynthesis protein TonB
MTNQFNSFRTLRCLTVIALSTSLLSAAALADTIYKSIDAEGNVTFSSTPPAGVDAQQIELQPGPTPAQQQQSLEAEQNLEAQSNEIPEEQPAPEQEQEEPVVQQDTEYQQDAVDNEDPVSVDDGYVGDPDRNERVRDGVDDVRDVAPRPAEAAHAAGRAR